MPRPRIHKDATAVPIAVRVSPATSARLDATAERLGISRAQAHRETLRRGLVLLEAAMPPFVAANEMSDRTERSVNKISGPRRSAEQEG